MPRLRRVTMKVATEMTQTSKSTVEIEQDDNRGEPMVVIMHANGDKQRMTVNEAHDWLNKNSKNEELSKLCESTTQPCVWCLVHNAVWSIR